MAAQPDPPNPVAAIPDATGVRIVNGLAVIALLYFGREVLIPITLALILGLLIAPLVRQIRRLGLGPVASVLLGVAAVTALLLGLAAILGSQVADIVGRLPQYAETISAKLQLLQSVTLSRLELMQGQASRLFGGLAGASQAGSVLPVEIHERAATPMQVISQLFATIWGPLGTGAIVLVVLVFVLLEHESLRDRFIRLTGGADLRGTTSALNDASERLSRYFVSQFAVNAGVGTAIGLGLGVIGLPNGVLWAVLAAVLRFIPYIGVWIAALCAGVLAAAVDPGWTLVLATLGLFGTVELIAGQAIEPYLYGHSTGLSPLSVVIAAIFWSWIWGPVGLLVSTPLTLCLVVAGRHTKALAFVDVLLGDTPALSLSQRFYQRALSGDADEIIATAREFLKRKSFARYCDEIVLPAMELAAVDLEAGRIGLPQRQIVGAAVTRVIEALGPRTRTRAARRRGTSVLEAHSLGLRLRQRREELLGPWQGPVVVAPGSVVLCLGLGSLREDLVTELLVRVLRALDIDARHLSENDLTAPPPENSSRDSIAMVFIVSDLRGGADHERRGVLAARIRREFPAATLVAMVPQVPVADAEQEALVKGLDQLARNFEAAAQLALDLHALPTSERPTMNRPVP
jgi:predicted PurR-regulated permease PerM